MWMKVHVKLRPERILVLVGGFVLIGFVFFTFSFLKWLHYDSSTQAEIHSALVRNKTLDPAESDAEHPQLGPVSMGCNPFFASGEPEVEAEPFPELCFNGLILGE